MPTKISFKERFHFVQQIEKHTQSCMCAVKAQTCNVLTRSQKSFDTTHDQLHGKTALINICHLDITHAFLFIDVCST